MSIKIGNIDISYFKVGGADCSIYVGDVKMYPTTPPTPSSPKYVLTLSDSSTVSAECDSTSSVTSGEVATQYSGSVVSAEIGDCVTSIGTDAFRNCGSLTSVTIPNSVTSIGGSTFRNCGSLTSVIIPSGVTNISSSVFDNCRSLTSVTIPNSVTFIGDEAFYKCSGLTSVTIPSSVTFIGSSAFEKCTSLTSCTIGSGVTTIGGYVFNSCSGLTSVVIYATTPPTLGGYVFNNTNNCPIYVPSESVETYKAAAGWSDYASRIQAIPTPTPSSPKYVLTLSDSSTVSAECDATSAITSGEVSSQYSGSVVSAAVIGQCVTSIGDSAFRNCSGLTSIDIPNSVTSIGEWAFYYCTSLTSITIPSGVTNIVQYAFYSCSSLTSVTIGNSVTNIGYRAFQYCSGLTSVTVEATTPPTLKKYAFNNTNDCPIYVPSESVDTYKAASGWSTYASRIRAIPNS